MPAEGLTWLAASGTAHRRRAGAAGRGARRPRGATPAVDRRRTTRSGRGCPISSARFAALSPGPRDLADHQRAGARRAGRRPRPRRDCAGSTSPWTPSIRPGSPGATRRDRHADVLAGLARGAGRRADAGQGQRGAAARGQRRRGAGAAGLVPAARLQLRIIEQMPLDPQHGWDRARMMTAERGARRAVDVLPDGAGARPGECSGRGLAGARRAGTATGDDRAGSA